MTEQKIDVLLVGFSDTEGGAARATYRMLKSLRSSGVNAKLFVLEKKSRDENVITLNSWFLFITRVVSYIEHKFWHSLFKPSEHFSFQFLPSIFVRSKIIKLNPKVVHLHWISRGVLSVSDIKKLNRKVFITLHDNNLITAGCHVKMQCGQYLKGCKQCPKVARNSALLNYCFKFKKERLKQSSIHWICISQWVQQELLVSEMYNDTKHENSVVTNPLNTDVFKPFPKTTLKELFGFENKKIIIFSALSINNYNKGFDILLDSLKELNKTYGEDDVVILVLGNLQELPNSSYNIISLGLLSDEISLNIYYSLADVMVVPSRQETLCQSATESISCGTPVVGFQETGLTEVIEHKTNGYLAKFESSKDLSFGIEYCLSDLEMNRLSKNSRIIAVKKFSMCFISEKIKMAYKLC